MMSQLGQLQPAVVGQFQTPPVYMYYGPRFVRRSAATPGQPYSLSVTSQEVEEAVYKDLPTDVKTQTKVAGANPQKMVTLKNGLEVPVYLIQRDIERKKAEKLRPPPPPIEVPTFHAIGVFASKKPLQASITALVVGAIAGHIFYDIRNK